MLVEYGILISLSLRRDLSTYAQILVTSVNIQIRAARIGQQSSLFSAIDVNTLIVNLLGSLMCIQLLDTNGCRLEVHGLDEMKRGARLKIREKFILLFMDDVKRR